MPVAYGLIDPRDLSLPHLPDRLIGSRIAHITDVHAWRPSHKWTRVANQLSGLRLDLVIYTGDYACDDTDEQHAFAALRQFTEHLRPTLGSFGVYGNHDNAVVRQLTGDLPINWIGNGTVTIEEANLELIGVECDARGNNDMVDVLLSRPTTRDDASRKLRIGLCHYPHLLACVADMGCDLMFSGHTHGGQCRFPWGQALVNCTDMPLRYTSGILRHRNLLCAVSRGCGSGPMPPRVWAPAHVPVYTLRKGPMQGRYTDGIDNLQPW